MQGAATGALPACAVDVRLFQSMPQLEKTIAHLQEAVTHHRAGRLSEAEQLYQHVLQTAPDNPDTLRLMAGNALQTGSQSYAVNFSKSVLVGGAGGGGL